MAEHVWFIPVTGGSSGSDVAAAFPIAPTRDLTNVQWNFSVFPVGQEPPAAVSCLSYNSITRFTMGQEGPPITPARLNDCYGSWTWRSCADDQNIITGGQLAVGTVFSRQLTVSHGDDVPPNIVYTWDDVEVFAKYRVSNVNRLDNIYLTINEASGTWFPNPVSDDWGNCVSNTWRVVGTRKNNAWSGWEDIENLRVTLNFQGTTNLANVGLVTVDVEWFAFRLSDQEE
jgi:hypothetical protein